MLFRVKMRYISASRFAMDFNYVLVIKFLPDQSILPTVDSAEKELPTVGFYYLCGCRPSAGLLRATTAKEEECIVRNTKYRGQLTLLVRSRVMVVKLRRASRDEQ